MGEPCTGGSRGIGQLGRVLNVKGMKLSWEFIGEGQTRRGFSWTLKLNGGCRGCQIVWCVAYRIY